MQETGKRIVLTIFNLRIKNVCKRLHTKNNAE
jgi:hypothetical protein